MLYYMWSRYGHLPSDIHNRSTGEKVVLSAFYEYRMEELSGYENVQPVIHV